MTFMAASSFAKYQLHVTKYCQIRLHFCVMMASSAKAQNSSIKSCKSLIAVAQMTATSNKEDNWKTISSLVSSGAQRGAKMIFLPEACDYIGDSKQQSVEYAEDLEGNFVQQCKRIAEEHSVWLSVGGFHQKIPSGCNSKLLNTHIIISDKGKVEAQYCKAHLFDLEIEGKVRLCESDYVLPGQSIVPPVVTPVGRLGLAICYDLRFAEMALILAQQGAHIITYPSAFTQTTGMAHWKSLLRSRAIETQCYVVAAAQTGKHNSKRTSYGHAMVVDPWGAVVAECSEGTGLCFAEIDLNYVDKVRTDMPVWQHRRTDLYGSVRSMGNDTSQIPPDEVPTYKFGHVTLKSTQVFYKSPLSLAVVNIKPVLPGHMMVISQRPAAHLRDLSPAEVTDLFTTVQTVSEVVKKHFGAASMTVAVQDGPEAGQTVQHVHVHILPRKKDDFKDNDDVYDEIQNHDKGWTSETRLRSEEEMADEAQQLRRYFYPS